jgi:hypothetical protein
VTAATAAAVATGATGYTFIATGGSTAENQQQHRGDLGQGADASAHVGSRAVGEE